MSPKPDRPAERDPPPTPAYRCIECGTKLERWHRACPKCRTGKVLVPNPRPEPDHA